jgi:NAD(P)H dehydrogenase (quinone)
MTTRVAVVYHSRSGRTRALAEAVVRGASAVPSVVAHAFDVEAAVPQDELARADAIVFGSPTYMGSASAPFKAFMDASAPVWALQGWRDKLAAGFTHSAAPSGDKLGTLVQLAVFAAQHGMVWVGLGLPPSYASAERAMGRDDTNRLGSHIGAMGQTPPGGGPVSEGDARTCEHLGRRVAELALRWSRSDDAPNDASRSSSVARHAASASWVFPPEPRAHLPGVRRVNLRELAARPGRFEHHLTVVARVGRAQLEMVTASESLAFAHVNVSDEYALALPTGDGVIDGFPLRTFVADAATGQDAARYNHRVGDLVLHPFSWMHWPGRLRPPFEPFVFPAGMRRCGLTVVFCGSSPIVPAGGHERPPGVSDVRALDAKSYQAAPPPLGLADLWGEHARTVARVGEATMVLVIRPERIPAPRGAYVLVLEADAGGAHHACDLLYLSPGSTLDGDAVARALVLSDEARDAEPPPASWERVPQPPFAPFNEVRRVSLPVSRSGITLTPLDAAHVGVAIGAGEAIVPRHWLARMLFRIALHRPLLGYVETYGGLFFDDREGVVFGLRGHGVAQTSVAQAELLGVLEALYLAVAPDGYLEP